MINQPIRGSCVIYCTSATDKVENSSGLNNFLTSSVDGTEVLLCYHLNLNHVIYLQHLLSTTQHEVHATNVSKCREIDSIDDIDGDIDKNVFLQILYIFALSNLWNDLKPHCNFGMSIYSPTRLPIIMEVENGSLQLLFCFDVG